MKFKLSRKLKILVTIFLILLVWTTTDLFGPWHTDLRKFDPKKIASLETDMWKAYYNKENFRLYRSLIELLQQQGFPFFRANYHAYLAARAAIVFKKGHNRKDYELALPYLTKYYEGIKNIGALNCDPEKVARKELEWWIIHRERLSYGKAALVKSVAEAAGELYGKNPAELRDYAEFRTEAMIIRDDESIAGGVNEKDWQLINSKLFESYRALAASLSSVQNNF